MKLRFRIPEEDEEDDQDGSPAEEDRPDVADLAPRALILGLGAASTQVFWPLPVPFLVLFGLIGAAAGVAWLMRVGGRAPLAGLSLSLGLSFFMPSNVDVGFTVRTTSVAIAAFGLTMGAGSLIERALGDEGDS